MRSIRDVLPQDAELLRNTLALDANEARLEIQILLQQVLNVARSYLIAHPERILSIAETNTYQALLQRRLNGEPIAYILGEREFFGLNLCVTNATLIPRPDTELLVELALERIPSPPAPLMKRLAIRLSPQAGKSLVIPPAGEGRKTFRVLDMGTGSGAIALAIAHQRPDAEVWACDASPAALEVARANAQQLGLARAHFIESNWFSALSGQRFNVIASNPPYIAAEDTHLSQGDVRFEPMSALASGADGLDDIRRIVAQAGAHLEPDGWLLLEHGYDQAAPVRELLQAAGFSAVFSAKDLAGIERCSGGQLR